MTTDYPTTNEQPILSTPTRRGWLKRLGLLLGSTLLSGPVLARAARRSSPAQVQGAEPFVGEIMLCAFGRPPQGYALCQGQLLAINTNQALFSLIGNIYGGDGITTFALPDLRSRVPKGTSTAANPQVVALGQKGGAENVVLTQATLPAHNHGALGSGAAATSSTPVGNVPAAAVGTNLNGEAVGVLAYGSSASLVATGNQTSLAGTSGPAAVATQEPYVVLNYCISLSGTYPPRN